jgi:hypothetical protein
MCSQANKVVLSVHEFDFPISLTWFHSVVTAAGMAAMARCGMFEVKALPVARTAAVSACYVGYIVFNNLSIEVRECCQQGTVDAPAPASSSRIPLATCSSTPWGFINSARF